jgi:hypothetical protein
MQQSSFKEAMVQNFAMKFAIKCIPTKQNEGANFPLPVITKI